MDLHDVRSARSALRMLDGPTGQRRTSRSPSADRRSTGYTSDDATADLAKLTSKFSRSHPVESASTWRRPEPVHAAPQVRESSSVAIDPCATLDSPVAVVAMDTHIAPAPLRPIESTPLAMTCAAATSLLNLSNEPNSLVHHVMKSPRNGPQLSSPADSPQVKPILPSHSVPYIPPAMRPRAQTSIASTETTANPPSSGALPPKYRPPHLRASQLGLNLQPASLSQVASSAVSTPSSMISMPSPALLMQQQYQQQTASQLQNLFSGHRFYRPPASPQPHQLSHGTQVASAQQQSHGRARADTVATAVPIARAPMTVNWWETPVTPSTYANFPSPVPPLVASQVQAQREAQQQQIAMNAQLLKSLTTPDSPSVTLTGPCEDIPEDEVVGQDYNDHEVLQTRGIPAMPTKRLSDADRERATAGAKRPTSMYLSPAAANGNAIPSGPLSAPFKNPEPLSPLAPQQSSDMSEETRKSLREKYALKLPPRKRNKQLRDFELIDTLGTGTFGRVYLCRERFGPQDEFFALKVLRKVDVVRLKQVEHINSEKDILNRVRHPFIVNMFVSLFFLIQLTLNRHCTFQDDINLYMLMEYIIGGELFSHLRKAGRFTNDVTRFFAAEIVLALEYLHSQDVVYRDLKPENLLLDQQGHIKITDFGFAKRIEDRTWTLCGTPEYLAPEIIQSKGHGKAVDWWALGILTFEMLAGYPPFFDDNPFGIYEKILSGRLQFPAHFNLHAKDLIRRLLTADRSQRLGNMKGGAADVKEHKWFRGTEWEGLLSRTVRAPIQPKYRHPGDTGNFEKYPPERGDIGGLNTGHDPYRHLFKAF